MKIGKSQFVPQAGERAVVIGKTGSGKTAFSLFLLQNSSETPFILYDTKEEPKFAALPNSKVCSYLKEVDDAVNDYSVDYVVFRPPLEITSDPDALDSLLLNHYHRYKNIGCYVDELYTFHTNGRAGKGLIGILTRGRSRGITFIGCSQRPSWISRFCLSEAEKYYIFTLVDRRDKKTLGEVIPDFDKLKNPSKHHFYFYESSLQAPLYCSPIPLDKSLNTGWTDGEDDDKLFSQAKAFVWI
jgi:hypothetical protein